MKNTETISKPADQAASVSGNEPLLTEDELADWAINRCKVYRNLCTWELEPGKSEFFSLFQRAPRGESGLPALDAAQLQLAVRKRVRDEAEWDEIKWILGEVCAAWSQWLYAVKKWKP